MNPRRAMTPAMARERGRLGALRARTLGCACAGPRTLGALGDLSASLTLPPLSSAQVRAALPADLQASWDAHASSYNASAATQAGATAALSLASGHFDNAAAVHAFAGAVAAVPGVGPIMAGLTEFFYANGAAIGDSFGKLFGLVHCNVDDRSPAQWMANARLRPAANSFAAVAVPMLALAWSDYAACREGASGIPWKPCSQVIPAAVAAWNAIATGAVIDYFVPALNASDCRFLVPLAGAVHTDSGFIYNATQGPYAFAPLSTVPSSMLGGEGLFWARVKAKAGPVAAQAPAPKKIISLHLGPRAPSAADVALHEQFSRELAVAMSARARAHAPMGVGTKVAAAAGVGGVGALLWWLASHGWNWVTPRWASRLLR